LKFLKKLVSFPAVSGGFIGEMEFYKNQPEKKLSYMGFFWKKKNQPEKNLT
jgi:hypothetical protein